jgi:hypothetical protein
MQELVGVTAKGLVRDVGKRIERLRAEGGSDLSIEQRMRDWGDLVFRSLLSSGGRMVLADPGRYLGLKDEGQDAMVSHVGNAVLDLILEQPPGEIDRIFGKESLEKVIKAALTAVAEHPEIIGTDNKGLKRLISDVAAELGRHEILLAKDMIPEFVRIILEKSGKNVYLFWPEMAKEPGQHLLLTAVGYTLQSLAREPAPGERWTPHFG